MKVRVGCDDFVEGEELIESGSVASKAALCNISEQVSAVFKEMAKASLVHHPDLADKRDVGDVPFVGCCPKGCENAEGEAVNEAYIAARAAALDGVRPATPKAVDSELSRLASFLALCAAQPAVSTRMATPQDMVDYLISKELDGRTQYHSSLCPRVLSASVGACINKDCDPLVCQIRAAPGSIWTAPSNLKTGLARLGLTGPWNAGRGTGNPVDSKKVALHIARFEDEAAKASILPCKLPH
ncbi:hypothetical protein HDU77_008209 [Chytriomyces hyalinus]|nr:hypothetical protein HDU77_008209 [Chytriomyces hyalinus]